MNKTKQAGEGTEFLRYFGPLLDVLRELGGSGTPSEVIGRIAAKSKIPKSVQNEILESGNPRLATNIAWTRYYLTREGLLDLSRRGVWTLSERGRSATLDYAQSLEIFRKWVKVFAEARKKKKNSQAPVDHEPGEQPPEIHQPTPTSLRDRLAELLLSLSPSGFERLCQRLLRESGFVQVVVTGRTGDGGIDTDRCSADVCACAAALTDAS